MATTTTFLRARPATSADAQPSDDLTPSALGALGEIVVTEDAAADGGATVAVSINAYSWTGVHGASLDPRTQRPFRVAPWVPAYPADLLDLVAEEPLGVYLATPSPATYASLLAALAAMLGEWGWTMAETVD